MQPYSLMSGDISEKAIHLAVMHWIKLHPHIVKYIMHFPNEGKRNIGYGALLKAMGMRAGVSDLFIALPRHTYGGAWIELKSKDGVLSIAQRAFLDDMAEQNYFTAICYSIEEAINTIKWYCFG